VSVYRSLGDSKYVTPEQRYRSEAPELLDQRDRLYHQARARHPHQWSEDPGLDARFDCLRDSICGKAPPLRADPRSDGKLPVRMIENGMTWTRDDCTGFDTERCRKSFSAHQSERGMIAFFRRHAVRFGSSSCAIFVATTTAPPATTSTSARPVRSVRRRSVRRSQFPPSIHESP
jgi:hypothetical protein